MNSVNDSFFRNLHFELPSLIKDDDVNKSRSFLNKNTSLAPLRFGEDSDNNPVLTKILENDFLSLKGKSSDEIAVFLNDVVFMSFDDKGNVKDIVANKENTERIKKLQDNRQEIGIEHTKGIVKKHDLSNAGVRTFTSEELGVLSQALNKYFAWVMVDRKLKEDPNAQGTKLPHDRVAISKARFQDSKSKELSSSIPKPDPDFTKRVLITVLKELEIAHQKQAQKELKQEKINKSIDETQKTKKAVASRQEKEQTEIKTNNDRPTSNQLENLSEKLPHPETPKAR